MNFSFWGPASLFAVISVISFAVIGGKELGIFRPSNPFALPFFFIWLTIEFFVNTARFMSTRLKVWFNKFRGTQYTIRFLSGIAGNKFSIKNSQLPMS